MARTIFTAKLVYTAGEFKTGIYLDVDDGEIKAIKNELPAIQISLILAIQRFSPELSIRIHIAISLYSEAVSMDWELASGSKQCMRR